MEKKIARLRRAKSTRAHIRTLGVPRLSVLRTGQHLYAQVFSADGAMIASVDTVKATLSLRSPVKDPKTGQHPVTTLVMTAKLNNCSQAADTQAMSCR